jgi:hypothetical protein
MVARRLILIVGVMFVTGFAVILAERFQPSAPKSPATVTQVRRGVVVNNERVTVRAGTVVVDMSWPANTTPDSMTSGAQTMTMENVTIETNGVTISADRAVLKDGEYRLDGNVRVSVPTP